MGICDFFVCTQLETQLSTNAALFIFNRKLVEEQTH